MLKLPIKAGKVHNLTDARFFAAWGVRWLGFQLSSEAPNFIDPIQMKAIREWVEGPFITGEFKSEDAAYICEMVDVLELQAVQVERYADLPALGELLAVPIIQRIVPESIAELDSLEYHLSRQSPFVDLFFLDLETNKISWSDLVAAGSKLIDKLCRWEEEYALLYSFYQLAPEDLEPLIAKLQPHGLHFVGGAEEKVGFKSFDELNDLFEELEVQM
ncbi:MAG: hypothetical protein AAF990_08240 [Bacteroidota bacterium]